MLTPDRIGRYQVHSVVGVGGFAVVLRALDESLQDVVAIKVLAENWAREPRVRERFLGEARLLRRIRSQHLVTVHDVGELDDGRPYFVMEFANRGTLANRLEARHATTLDPASLITLATVLAEGLGALHAAGVVHRDVNPRNIFIQERDEGAGRPERMGAPTRIHVGLIAPGERLMLGDLGLAKDLIRAGPAVSVLGGTPSYQAPEQLDPRGEVSPATDVYGATGVLWEAMTGEPPPEPAGLDRALATLPPAWRPVLGRGLAALPEDRFETTAQWLAAVLNAAGAGDGELGRKVVSRLDLTEVAEGPYLGLATFQPEDATRFFGRDSLVTDLVRRLRRDRVLVMGGPSGSGKSSVVRAGLIPAIATGALPGSEHWPLALFTPRADPMAELAHQLERAGRVAGRQLINGLTAADLAAEPERARDAAESITDASGGLLLVVDQFEELFTQSDRRDDQDRFLQVLAGMVDPTDSRVRAVFVMRADFYTQSAYFPWLAEKISVNQVLVGPMSRHELRQAIEEPARLAYLRLEEGLVDALLEDGRAQPGALPLVSHAMAETWRRRRGSALTLDGYRQAGGVGGAIAQTADEVYQRLDPAHRQTARRLLLRMVNPGEGTSDTRRRLSVGELSHDVYPDLARDVVDALTSARLLTIDRDTIELAHEALIGSWPRLRDWIGESRDDLRARQRIGRAASEWDAQGRQPDLLYRGTALQAATEWAERHPDVLTTLDREFMDESVAAHTRQVQADQAADRRSRRVRSTAIGLLAVLLAVAMVSAIVGFNGFRTATRQLSLALATQAADVASENPRLALALAVEATTRGAGSFEARSALVDATRQLESSALAPVGSPIEVGDALTLGLSPRYDLLGVGSRQGGLKLYDPDGRGPIGDVLTGHTGAVEEITFTPDGRQMVTVGQDGAILRWDLTNPSDVHPPDLIGRAADILWGAAMSPNGETLATAGEDGVIQLWDLENRTPIGSPLTDDGFDMLTVRFSPDGSILLAGNGRGQMIGWEMESRRVALERFSAHGSDIWEIVFAPSGGAVATASSDGRIRLWDLSGDLLAEPFAETTEDVRGVQFLQNGDLLAAGDETGKVRTWSVVENREVSVTTLAHGRQVIAGTTSPMGSQYLSLSLDQTVITWGAPTGLSTITGHLGGAYGLAVSADGRLLASGDGEGNVRIYDSASRDLVAGPVNAEGAVWALAFSPDGKRLFGGDAAGGLLAIEVDTGGVVARVEEAHDGAVAAIAWSEGRLLTGGADGLVRIWNADLQPAGSPLGPHSGGVTDLAVNPDGVVAASDRSGMIHFWDADLVAADEPLAADDNTVWGVAWSPDGRHLAAASDDWVVLVFDSQSWAQMAALTPHPEGATDVEFLGDGGTVATTSRDGSVRLFDLPLEREIGSVIASHRGPAWRLRAIPGSTRYVTSSEDGSVRIWDELDLERACQRAEQAFDEEQRRRYLGPGEEAQGCR
ncbi:MAG: nSTAND1 domain-containing NTPase [Actinomycetota bacterium]